MYESTSKEIRYFQPVAIPGLLQTENYAKLSFRILAGRSEDEINKGVSERIHGRQSLLKNESITFCFLIFQTALVNCLGGSETMYEQIQHLQQYIEKSNIQLHFISSTLVLPAIPITPFVVYDRRLVLIDLHDSIALIREENRINRYLETFVRFLENSISGDAARKFLTQVAMLYNKTPQGRRDVTAQAQD